jgi:hypothetical protein
MTIALSPAEGRNSVPPRRPARPSEGAREAHIILFWKEAPRVGGEIRRLLIS